MPSSKGKPTDPKLREKVKEEIKNKPNSDGGGKGQWSAWKAAQLSKEYEKRGGGYENEAGSKNEPKKGPPEPKGEEKQKESKGSAGKKKGEGEANGNGKSDKENEGPGANEKKARAPKKSASSKPQREGTRRSSRQAEKRKADDEGETKKPSKARKSS